jgi:S1-C subfamily serine protease
VRLFKLETETGVLVTHLEPDSPASRGGLQEGDVIVAIDATPIDGIDTLHRQLTDERVGVAAKLSIIRQTEMLKLDVTPLESRPRG